MLLTPEFFRTAQQQGLGVVAIFQHSQRIAGWGTEPSMLVGNPTITTPFYQDEGRTVQVPAPFKFLAIRSDEEPEDGEEDTAISYVTFMLPHEY